MNVQELIEILQELPPDFEVRTEEEPIESVEVVRTRNGNWVWVG